MLPTSLPRSGFGLDAFAELEIPPAVHCARCSRSDCDGCTGSGRSLAGLAWESTHGTWLSRYWITARQTVRAGAAVSRAVKSPKLGQALTFAFAAELGAAVSLVSVLWLAAPLLLPPSLLAFVGDFGALRAYAGFTLGLALFMVWMHALWGIGLELALRSTGARLQWSRSLTFALYACGWDLLTSPTGLVFGIAAGGVETGVSEVREAARVPRVALTRYLTTVRGLDAEQASKVGFLSFVMSVGFAAVLVVAALAFIVVPAASGLLG